MPKNSMVLYCLLFTVIFLIGYMYFVEPNLLVVKNIKIENIEKDNTPSYKIAFFTDTHFGKNYNSKNVERIVKIINENEVDIIIFGGDFFDNYSRDKELLDLEYLSEQLIKMNCKYGKYAVFGNHDFGGSANRVYYELFNNSGFDILTNQNSYIEEIEVRIIGFEDAIFGEVNEELYNIKSTDFNILVSHEPDIVDKINMKQSGIMLSGHTHGGQIYTPFMKKLPPLGEIYTKGVYNNVSKNQNISIYVSSGIGTTFLPIRFLNIPEVCILTIE